MYLLLLCHVVSLGLELKVPKSQLRLAIIGELSHMCCCLCQQTAGGGHHTQQTAKLQAGLASVLTEEVIMVHMLCSRVLV